MYCRLCLYQARILIPMRDEGGNVSTDILDTVDRYIKVQLTSVDCICVSCWSSVDNFRKFCLLIAERQAQYEWRKEAAEETYGNTIAESTAIVKYMNDCLVPLGAEESGATEIVGELAQQESRMREEADQPLVLAINTAPEKSLDNGYVYKNNISSKAKIMKDVNLEATHPTPKNNGAKNECMTAKTPNNLEELKSKTPVREKEENANETLQIKQTEHTESAPEKIRTEVVPPSLVELAAINNKTYSSDILRTRKLGRPRQCDARNQDSEDQLIASHMQLFCDVCKLEVDCFKKLMFHFKAEHNTNGYVICCQKRLYKRGILIDHINVHRNPAYFSCASCDTNFADRLCLRNHLLLKHQQKTESPHECTICGMRFAKVRFLQRHARKHANDAVGGKEEQQQQCTLCEKSYANATLLQTHIKQVHDRHSTNVCSHCGAAVNGKQCYARHLAQHGVQSESTIASTKRGVQRMQCSDRGQGLARKSSLRLHMQRHEDPQSTFVCELCGKEAKTRIALNAHKRFFHDSKQRQHTCNVCARAFNTTRRLREHMTTHTGEDLYSCNFCYKRFKCSSNLYAHRKWKHPEEWAHEQNAKALKQRT